MPVSDGSAILGSEIAESPRAGTHPCWQSFTKAEGTGHQRHRPAAAALCLALALVKLWLGSSCCCSAQHGPLGAAQIHNRKEKKKVYRKEKN